MAHRNITRFGLVALFAGAAGCGYAEDDPRRTYPETPEYAARQAVAMFELTLRIDPDMSERRVSNIRELRALIAKAASTMPADREGHADLHQLMVYFDATDIFDAWMECRDSAAKFSAEGTTARDVMRGAIDVMRRLDIEPRHNQSLRHFGALYQDWRADDHLSHEATIDLIVSRRKFANRN